MLSLKMILLKEIGVDSSTLGKILDRWTLVVFNESYKKTESMIESWTTKPSLEEITSSIANYPDTNCYDAMWQIANITAFASHVVTCQDEEEFLIYNVFGRDCDYALEVDADNHWHIMFRSYKPHFCQIRLNEYPFVCKPKRSEVAAIVDAFTVGLSFARSNTLCNGNDTNAFFNLNMQLNLIYDDNSNALDCIEFTKRILGY